MSISLKIRDFRPWNILSFLYTYVAIKNISFIPLLTLLKEYTYKKVVEVPEDLNIFGIRKEEFFLHLISSLQNFEIVTGNTDVGSIFYSLASYV